MLYHPPPFLTNFVATMALSKKDLEEIVKSLRGEFSTITSKLTKMEAQLDAIVAENKELKSMVSERDTEIRSLKLQLNSIEQYNRSWSVRIMGLPLTTDEERSPDLIKQKIYTSVLLPILQGASSAGDLREVPPDANRVLERAHVLRAKEGAIKPVIARFYERDIRALIFRHKKAFAPKHVAGPLKDRYKFQIFEDLTSINSRRCRRWPPTIGSPPAGQQVANSASVSQMTPPSEESRTSLTPLKKLLAKCVLLSLVIRLYAIYIRYLFHMLVTQ